MVWTNTVSSFNLYTPASSEPPIPVSTFGSTGIDNPQRALLRSPGPIFAAQPDVLARLVSRMFVSFIKSSLALKFIVVEGTI